ncbi:MAG: DUF4381 family protein [Verrucomicrobiota bacterium]
MNPLEDIRDIQGPIPFPSPWGCIGGIILTLLIIGGIIWWITWWKKNRKKTSLPKADAIALQSLEEAMMWIEKNSPREFSFAVSEIIRVYIENRFQVFAARKTTEEFLRDLLEKHDSPLAQWKNSLEDFLMHCDLAKFGKHPLTKEAMMKMLESAKTFVMQTTSQVEEAKA